MTIPIIVPSVGESVQQATVSQILKPTGSQVRTDEELLELETDKVNQVLYAAQSGTVTWSVQVGDTVKVGQSIGQLTPGAAPAAAEKKPPIAAPVPSKMEMGSATTPLREFTEEFLQEDRLSKPAKVPASDKPKTAAGTSRKRMSGLRKTIAERLVQVKNQTAMLTTFNEVDMSTVMQIRKQEREAFEKKHGVKLGMMSFFVKACVSALKEIPAINAYIDGDEIVQMSTYDISVAVSTDKGLLVPVIRKCDELSYAEIEKKLGEFAEKSRQGTISVDDLKGGSFTITNGGRFGSLLSTPILNPPQSAILGMHTIVERPVAVEGKVEIRPMMYLALSYDHRIVDGKEAVLFLIHIKQILEDPHRLLLDL